MGRVLCWFKGHDWVVPVADLLWTFVPLSIEVCRRCWSERPRIEPEGR